MEIRTIFLVSHGYIFNLQYKESLLCHCKIVFQSQKINVFTFYIKVCFSFNFSDPLGNVSQVVLNFLGCQTPGMEFIN